MELAEYKVLVSLEFLQIERPAKRDREVILSFLEGLGKDPFQRGDYEERDEVGRTIQIKIISKHALTFWADHAVKEVKVTKIESADRK